MTRPEEPEYLLLKWHTLKGWRITSAAGLAALQEFFDIGVPMSAMLTHLNDQQKELLCTVIDECTGTIQDDWSGDFLTKEQAKAYVMEGS